MLLCAPHNFSFRASVGVSWDLLAILDSSEVEVWSSLSDDHVLIIHGRFVSSNEVMYFLCSL